MPSTDAIIVCTDAWLDGMAVPLANESVALGWNCEALKVTVTATRRVTSSDSDGCQLGIGLAPGFASSVSTSGWLAGTSLASNVAIDGCRLDTAVPAAYDTVTLGW